MRIQRSCSYLMLLLITLISCNPALETQTSPLAPPENIRFGEPVELVLEPAHGCPFDMHGQGNHLMGSSILNTGIKFIVIDMETQQVQLMDPKADIPRPPIIRYFIDIKPDYSTEQELWGYDSRKRKEHLITARKISNPAISENIVVWNEIRDGQCNIYGYNFVNQQHFTVTQSSEVNLNPKISGNWVVYNLWSIDDQYRLELRAYHMLSQEDIFIGHMSTMAISLLPSKSFDVDQNRVVWRTVEQEIHIYDLENKTEETIFQGGSGNYVSSVDIAGDLVIWNGGAQDKRGYDLLYDKTFEVPHLPASAPEHTGVGSVFLTRDYIAWLVNIEDRPDWALGTPLAPGEPIPKSTPVIGIECNKKLFIAPIIRE